MKRKSLKPAMVLMMACAVLFTSCLGSFRLTRNVYDWNQTVGSKFANELVFLAFTIIPVYEVAVVVDTFVLNSIEFWSGENPMASNEVKAIETENGRVLVRRTGDGYELTVEATGATTGLRFDEAAQTWSVQTADGRTIPFMSFIDENNVRIYLQDGTSQVVELSEAGVMAFRETVQVCAPTFAIR